MANEDLNQDPNFTTPGGAPLAALARNPHQNVDVVHGVTGGGTPESTVVLQLVDYVPEHTVGGSTQRVDISDRVNSFQFVDLNNPANSDVLWTTPTDTNPFVDNPNEIFSFSGSNFDKPAIQFTLNSPVVVSAFRVVGPSTGPLVSGSYFMNGAGEVSPEGQHSEYIDPTGFTQASSTYTFSINENGLNEPSGVFERLYVYSEETTGATVVPAACTDFVRKIVDGIVTDYAADGVTPYTVQGQILPHCPESNGCSCDAELAEVKQELVEIKALVQQLLNNNPTQTQVDTGQPSLRLPSGTYTKAQILARLNTEHYNAFVDTNTGFFASYGLNSIVFAPSSTFDLSVAGSTSQTYDYPVSLEAGGNEYLLQEVDDFVVVVPTGETLDIHMVVWLTGVAA